MRFLITAIGSMSAECAIKRLKAEGHFVVGCDIYPGDWHYETKLCDAFCQAPFATKESEYIDFLLRVCERHQLSHIIPLTDLEIDIIDKHRVVFDEAGIVLCMQNTDVLRVARNKNVLYNKFIDDDKVPSIKTCLLLDVPEDFPFPCIAKPYNGRSSEGLIRNATREQVLAIDNKSCYILQQQLEGDIFTVDYIRDAKHNVDVAVPRKELLRTKNGAGLTIKTINDKKLIHLVSHIGQSLNINGCVNMEFIQSGGEFYLIDINPRFSAGVAFSVVTGYDMILNHVRCFSNESIDQQIPIKEKIIIKKYEEIIS